MSEQVRVLELGDGIATAYAAKLLGDHGADVIKVEVPEGDPARQRGPFANNRDPEGSGMFLALNVNKRGVTRQASDDLEELLAWADIVVHNLKPHAASAAGLDEGVFARHPALTVLAITPFGLTGPYASYEAEELTLSNAGGWANLCPSTSTDQSLPPLKVFGDQCALMAGIAGAMTALASHREARTSGSGERIDLSIQEYVASVLEAGIPAYSYREEIAARYEQRMLIPWRIFDAKDGPVFIVCVEQDQWERLVEFMGNPEWAQLEIFADNASRAENQDMVHTFVQEFVAEWNAQELYHAAQEHRICVAPVMGLAEIAANDHLRARGFFTPVTREEGPPIDHLASAILADGTRSDVRMPAPRLGQHNDSIALEAREVQSETKAPTLPLSGIRVLDLTWAWAGPYCSMNLAHLGAEVIRIESEKRADLYRRLAIHPEEWEEGLNLSGMFNQWNQGKSSMSVDLGRPEGIELVKALVKESDVVVQNFATGVMDRMGIGYETLQSLNPGIILASISGYGQTGPYREYMGYGPAMPPLTGLSAATGYIDGKAEEIGLSMPDPTAGITAGLGVVSALLQRDVTGLGQHLDISLWEATGVLNVEGWMQWVLTGTEPQRIGNRHTSMAPHGCFPCQGDDAWISIACRSDAEWQALAREIDPKLPDDPRFPTAVERKRNEDELEAIVAEWTRNLDRWDMTRRLQASGIAAFPTMTTADIVEDEHLQARGFIERLEHPEVGARAHAGIPWRFDNRSNGVSAPAPCLGADTSRHLRDILGYSDAAIAKLYEDAIIGV